MGYYAGVRASLPSVFKLKIMDSRGADIVAGPKGSGEFYALIHGEGRLYGRTFRVVGYRSDGKLVIEVPRWS